MKIILGIYAIFVIAIASDLNPLLLWEPYRIWLTEFLDSSPRLFLGMVLSAPLIAAWLTSSHEHNKKITH